VLQPISNNETFTVSTRGWQALAAYYQQTYQERYFPLPIINNIHTGFFHVSAAQMHRIGMDTSRIVVTRLDNFDFNPIDGDNFSVETALKNTGYWAAIRCNSVIIKLSGTKGQIDFKFVNPGCSRWLYYRLANEIITADSVDLSQFAQDLSQWRNIRIENHNQDIRLFLDKNQIFQQSYSSSIGQLKGISYIFHGSGYVDFCQLKDSDKNIILEKQF